MLVCLCECIFKSNIYIWTYFLQKVWFIVHCQIKFYPFPLLCNNILQISIFMCKIDSYLDIWRKSNFVTDNRLDENQRIWPSEVCTEEQFQVVWIHIWLSNFSLQMSKTIMWAVIDFVRLSNGIVLLTILEATLSIFSHMQYLLRKC